MVLFQLFTESFPTELPGGVTGGHVGINYPKDTVEGGYFVRVEKLGGQRDRQNDFPLVDVEVTAPTYDEAEGLIESIDLLLLGYPHSIATPSGVVVLDLAFVTRAPGEIPWDGPGRRLAATYSLSLRRRD